MQTIAITYANLFASFQKGLRNGNWKRLNSLDNALYLASLWYAKYRGSIVNAALVEKLSGVVERLKETKGMRIFKRDFKILQSIRSNKISICVG